MKTMRFASLPLLGCALVLASCTVRHTLPVGTLPSSRPVLAEATTFCLLDGCFEPWNEALRPVDLHREVARQLTLRGYRSRDYGPGLQPDLLVYCSVYAGPFRFSPVKLPEGHPLSSSPIPPWKTLRAGSVVIQFFDTRLRRVTWNGYADGLRDGEWAADERLLPRAAQLILDDYREVAPMIATRSETTSDSGGVKLRRLRE